VCVDVAVGITVAPPILEPPKWASALELMLENVAWTSKKFGVAQDETVPHITWPSVAVTGRAVMTFTVV
jgi:hypothetical protein